MLKFANIFTNVKVNKGEGLPFIFHLFFISIFYIFFFLGLSFFTQNFFSFLLLFALWSNAVFILCITRIVYNTYERYALLTPHLYQSGFKGSPIATKNAYRRYKWFFLIADVLFILSIFGNFTLSNTFLIVFSYAIFFDLIWLLLFKYLFMEPLIKISKEFGQKHDSDIIVYLSGREDSEYQLNQWINILISLNRVFRVTVVIKQEMYMDYGMNLPITCMRISELNQLTGFITNSKVKMILYVNNSPSNLLLLVLREYFHVHINHGDSDKAENALNTSKDYDFVFMPGKASSNRYIRAGWEKEKIVTIGRPQLQYLKDHKTKNRNGYNTILYAPTYEGNKRIDGYSSVATMGRKIVKSILNDGRFRILVKAHPFSGSLRQDHKNELLSIKRLILENPANGSMWIDNKKPEIALYDLFLESDILISDVSSVAIDYLILNQPIIATNHFGVDHEKFLDIIPFWQCSYMLYPENDLIEVLEAISENDALAQKRKKIAEYYLGENVFQDEKIEEQFINEIAQIIKTSKDTIEKNRHIPWEKFV